MSKCYLTAVTKRNRKALKRALLADEHVRYVIDHATHLKTVTRMGRRPPVPAETSVRTEDLTEHTDEMLWDICSDVARYVLASGEDEARMLAIIIHFLHNLLDVPEAWHLAYLATARNWIDHWLTDEKAHGWEIDALKKAGIWPRDDL